MGPLTCLAIVPCISRWTYARVGVHLVDAVAAVFAGTAFTFVYICECITQAVSIILWVYTIIYTLCIIKSPESVKIYTLCI